MPGGNNDLNFSGDIPDICACLATALMASGFPEVVATSNKVRISDSDIAGWVEPFGDITTVGAAKVGGGGSCPGCTITPGAAWGAAYEGSPN